MAIKISSGTNAKKAKQTMVKNGSMKSSAKASAKQAQARSIQNARNKAKATNQIADVKKELKAAGVGKTVKNIINTAATTNARAAAQANQISANAQAAQMAYNAQQAAQANAQNQANMQAQMQYNANQAALANAITQESWNRTAAYNTAAQSNAQAYNTAERLAAQEYNRQAVEEERAWQEKMAATEYQRRMADLKAAGLNPILAYTNGGASVGGGAAIGTHAASISPASVGSISGTAANAGLLGANAASSSSYTGILENTSNELALFGAIATSISTAIDSLEDAGVTMDTIEQNYDEYLDNTKNPFWIFIRTLRKSWKATERVFSKNLG